MSQIPYVNSLGDALDAAIARQPARAPRMRRGLGRRRWLAVALAALAVGGGGAAVAALFTDPVEVGFGQVGCYERTEPSGNVAIIGDPNRSPAELCASSLPSLGFAAGDLIACEWHGHGIVVVVRGDRGGCAARNLAPLPSSYAAARRRAARLQAVAVSFERRVGCLPPREFARRLTAELQAGAWAGWRAVAGGGAGPCGRVSAPSGAALLGGIAPAVDATRRTIAVKGRAPLDVELVIAGPGSPGLRLFESTGERCFTLPALEEHVRAALAPAGVPIRFRYGSLPPDTGIEPPRGDRYDEGCAIFVGAGPVFDGGRTSIEAELYQRGLGS
jgi:hypothetical protein